MKLLSLFELLDESLNPLTVPSGTVAVDFFFPSDFRTCVSAGSEYVEVDTVLVLSFR